MDQDYKLKYLPMHINNFLISQPGDMIQTYSKEELAYFIELAFEAELYDDSVQYFKALAETVQDITIQEFKLLSQTYKTSIRKRKNSLQLMQAREAKLKNTIVIEPLENRLKSKIEGELLNLSFEALYLIDTSLNERAYSPEERVLCLKLKGDFNYNIAEHSNGDTLQKALTAATNAYREATQISEQKLQSTNIYRLEVALCYSNFCYSCLKDDKLARKVAKQAFDEALKDIESLKQEDYQDTATVLQLLRFNMDIKLWDDEDENAD